MQTHIRRSSNKSQAASFNGSDRNTLTTGRFQARTVHRTPVIGLKTAVPDTRPDFIRAFAPFAAKMQRAGLPRQAIQSFRYYYNQLARGATGYIPSAEAQPLEQLPELRDLDEDASAPRDVLDRTVLIKLNGGLGTTMGLTGPKASIVVKDELSFLDIVVRQVIHMREQQGVRLPLLLMNSFNTQEEARNTLAAYPEFQQGIRTDFLQHKVPRIWKRDLKPVVWPDDPQLEWCPPGHGDIYLALLTSGALEELLSQGFEYALISNIDNLGATIDLDILGHFARTDLPILMEACERTPADRKGGHLATHPQKGLILREKAQCPPHELDAFQDIRRYRYFNTNNLWVNLRKLASVLEHHGGMLDLPLIRNEKTVDPSDPQTPPVYQLETAMGQAIAAFPNAEAILVPRARFLPVKDTNDLLAIWSDAYHLADDFTIAARRAGAQGLEIDLDQRYYGRFDQLQERFAGGVPSLIGCRSLKVRGDVRFDADAVLEGDVCIQHEDESPLHYTSSLLAQA